MGLSEGKVIRFKPNIGIMHSPLLTSVLLAFKAVFNYFSPYWCLRALIF